MRPLLLKSMDSFIVVEVLVGTHFLVHGKTHLFPVWCAQVDFVPKTHNYTTTQKGNNIHQPETDLRHQRTLYDS